MKWRGGEPARAPELKRALADAGYFDQAHPIRDFREFTTRPPMAVSSNADWRGGA